MCAACAAVRCCIGGLGYDPLFLSDELNKTFAEAQADEKNAVSHRARAIAALRDALDKE